MLCARRNTHSDAVDYIENCNQGNVPITVNGQEQQTDLISYEQKQFEWAKSYMLGGSLDTVQNELNTGLIVYEPQNTIQIGQGKGQC